MWLHRWLGHERVEQFEPAPSSHGSGLVVLQHPGRARKRAPIQQAFAFVDQPAMTQLRMKQIARALRPAVAAHPVLFEMDA